MKEKKGYRSKIKCILALINSNVVGFESEFLKKWGKYDFDKINIKPYLKWDGSIKEINELAPDKHFKVNGLVTCLKPWLIVTVLYDGRVSPCCRDHDAKYTCGNLKNETLYQIWRNYKFNKLRKCFSKNNLASISLCKNCDELYKIRKISL